MKYHTGKFILCLTRGISLNKQHQQHTSLTWRTTLTLSTHHEGIFKNIFKTYFFNIDIYQHLNGSCKISRIIVIVITSHSLHWRLGLTQGLFVSLYILEQGTTEPHNHIPILLFHKFKINLSIHSFWPPETNY